ncbi:MAG: efflux RND transporter permease subunit [Burkholderiales bacterium]|nr:efflux RND transporter permease subunit [Burkholderiales bacterium]
MNGAHPRVDAHVGISGRVAAYFQASRLTPLLALVALLLGVFALMVTPREEEPQINVTMANVFVPFPGASAQDVEALVATPGEQVLAQMSGVEHVFSVSHPGMAVLTVQFEVGVPRIDALVRLYDTIYSNRDWVSPNLGVLDPIIKPKGIDDVPVVALTLWREQGAAGAFELERIAHTAEAALKRVPGTREVRTLGGPGRVLRVLLDADRLNAFGISAIDVSRALQLANVSAPTGTLVRNNAEIVVETGNYLESAADVRSLLVGTHESRPVYVSDVAAVTDGPDRPGRYVWMGIGPASGEAMRAGVEHPAVTIEITKKPGENAVEVAERVLVCRRAKTLALEARNCKCNNTAERYGRFAFAYAQCVLRLQGMQKVCLGRKSWLQACLPGCLDRWTVLIAIG